MDAFSGGVTLILMGANDLIKIYKFTLQISYIFYLKVKK